MVHIIHREAVAAGGERARGGGFAPGGTFQGAAF